MCIAYAYVSGDGRAGDYLGFARAVGSARFARSAADGSAGWAPLPSLTPPLSGVCGRKNENVARCGPCAHTDSQTPVLGSRAGCKPDVVSHPLTNSQSVGRGAPSLTGMGRPASFIKVPNRCPWGRDHSNRQPSLLGREGGLDRP